MTNLNDNLDLLLVLLCCNSLLLFSLMQPWFMYCWEAKGGERMRAYAIFSAVASVRLSLLILVPC
jgi:hypothetical protein